MSSPGLSESLTMTLRSRSEKLRDAVSINSALMLRLKEKGRHKTLSGGRTIVREIEYAENGTYLRYSGYEPLNITPQDVFTAAEYEWKLGAMSVSISGEERLKNSGKEQILDLLEGRIQNAEKSFLNNLTRDQYSDGTASGGKQIGGLQSLVSDTGTGTCGGIDASTWSFWRNQIQTFAALSLTVNKDNIQEVMNNMYVKLLRGKDAPDLIVADNNYYLLYLASLQPALRVTNPKLADRGFQNLKFMGSDVVLDGGMNGAAPTNRMYFLNTDTIEWIAHRQRNMDLIGGDREPVNQDATIKLMGFMGNMAVTNRMLNGVMSNG